MFFITSLQRKRSFTMVIHIYVYLYLCINIYFLQLWIFQRGASQKLWNKKNRDRLLASINLLRPTIIGDRTYYRLRKTNVELLAT